MPARLVAHFAVAEPGPLQSKQFQKRWTHRLSHAAPSRPKAQLPSPGHAPSPSRSAASPSIASPKVKATPSNIPVTLQQNALDYNEPPDDWSIQDDAETAGFWVQDGASLPWVGMNRLTVVLDEVADIIILCSRKEDDIEYIRSPPMGIYVLQGLGLAD